MRPNCPATPVFAVLHIADLALHAILRLEPEAAGRPAGLLDGAQKRAVLIATNAAARARGVTVGQTAAQALALCGELLLRPRSAAAEAEARATLRAAGFAISPRVEETADGVCTVDLAGLDEARAQVLVAAAVAQLRQFALPATAGLASTPLLALYAARSLTAGPEARRVDEAAGRLEPPEITKHLRIVRDSRAFLAPLPLAVAEPSPELAAVLAGWGIHTLGALTDLPKAELARRLGAAGVELWERAAGETTRVLRLVEPPREFVAAMEFEHDVETLEPLLFILRRMVDRFALELDTALLAAAELALTLELRDETRYARSFRLPEPTTRADILFRTLHTHLEQLHTEAPIRAVRLQIEPTRPPHRQQGLFETGLRDPHGFAETLARVVAIVGSDRVGTPYVPDTHRPDAVVMEPPAAVVPPPARFVRRAQAAGTSGRGSARDAGLPETPNLESGVSSEANVPIGLPLRRLRPPVPARVEVEEGAPVSVWSEIVRDVVAAVRGPWRGAGDWWEAARAWEREEWDLELAGGGLYRVIRTPAGWFVEGEYD